MGGIEMDPKPHFESITNQRVAALSQPWIKFFDEHGLTPEAGAAAIDCVFSRISGQNCNEDHYLGISAVLYAAMDRVLRESAEASYLEASDHPVFSGIMSTVYDWSHNFSITADSLLEGFLVSVNVCYQMVRFRLSGSHVYDVSPGLAEQLRATSLKGVSADDLHLSYSSIYLVVPSHAGLRVWNSESGFHQCVGIYVSEEPAVHIRDLKSLENLDNLDNSGSSKCRGWRVTLIGAGKEGLIWDDAILYFQIALETGKSIDECLDIEQAFMQTAQAKNLITGGFGEWCEWRAVFDWLMNAVLYATYVEPGEKWEANEEARNLWNRIEKLPKGEKRSRLKERYRALPKQPRILLGRSIVVCRGQPESTTQSGPVQKALNLRVQVAGHWKRVAHGPGLIERRWQWIEPYWRGEGIELPSRRHSLN